MANMCLKKKKECSSSSFSRWDDLNPEILSQILVRLPIEERVGHVSLVCKDWLACVSGPYCWSEIDIQSWCRKRNLPVDDVDRVARKLMKRNINSFVLLSAYRLGDPGFVFSTYWGAKLKVLKMPMSEVTDKMVGIHADALVNLTVLDISHCLKITSKGIGEFGSKCKRLIDLTRNMPPPGDNDFKVDDSEATAIANTMPGLTKLEIYFGSFGKLGLGAILDNCKALSHLNIEGCEFDLDGDLLDKCLKLRFFKDPLIDEYYVDDGEDEDGDDEDEDSD